MDAKLRFATTEEERAAVYRLRYELYVEDQGLFHDEADHQRRWLIEALSFDILRRRSRPTSIIGAMCR